jgi:uncharacterized protein (UPF0335 family)
MPIIRIEDPKVFIGLSVETARQEIISHGYDTRVIQKNLPYKPDYDPLRICLFVEKDKVIDAKIG